MGQGKVHLVLTNATRSKPDYPDFLYIKKNARTANPKARGSDSRRLIGSTCSNTHGPSPRAVRSLDFKNDCNKAVQSQEKAFPDDIQVSNSVNFQLHASGKKEISPLIQARVYVIKIYKHNGNTWSKASKDP